MRAIFIAIFTGVAVLAVALPSSAVNHAFTQVVVQPAQSTGEPSIILDTSVTPARIHVAAPSSTTIVWTSFDGGNTFVRSPATGGGSGDSDVVFDANGVLYTSDLLAAGGLLASRIPVSVSYDHGATWARTVELSQTGTFAYDRQWMAAEGDGHVVVSARGGGTYFSWVSFDEGITWTGPHTIAQGVEYGGPLEFHGSTLYAAFTRGGQAYLGKSLDGGKTWTDKSAGFMNGQPMLFPAMDVDDAGNVYIAWSEGKFGPSPGLAPTPAIKLVVSKNGGTTWSGPFPITDPLSLTSSIMPWIVAGAAGKVNVAFFTSSVITDPDLGTPVTTWDVELAQSLNALASNPTFTRATIADNFHTGSICTSGLACVGPQNLGLVNAPTPFDRRILDFFEIDIDAAGNLYAAYVKDRPVTSGSVNDVVFSRVDVMVAKQTAGPTLR